ncbi:cell division protein FtsA [Bacteroides sp. OttesenSCG-928-F21]|nr:cell division protein FtsA [Bacteroides sp. OttesenSCG-928-F21]
MALTTTDFIAAIELGSSKIAGIAGRKNSDGTLHVLAYAQEESSSFIRKGVIFNLDKTAQSLTSIIRKLEATLQNSIGKVYVGVSGQSLHTAINIVSRELEEDTIISQELIDSICDENRTLPLGDKEILEVAPQEYRIGNNLQADPVGVAGNEIEGRFLNIIARSTIRKNLERSFNQANVEIAAIQVSPLLTAEAVLTENEMRSGCALVDLGADTTTVSIYKNNILRFLTVIPLGGSSITQDITSLRIEEEEAESLKKKHGELLYREEGKEGATVSLEDHSRTIELATLNDIIEARAEEIVVNVWNQIKQSNYESVLLAGLVITGGGINLKNMEELFRKNNKAQKIRVAESVRYELSDTESLLRKDGTQNTILGILASGKENCCIERAIEAPKVEGPSVQTNLFEDDEDLKQQKKEAEAKIKAEKEAERKKEKEKEGKKKTGGVFKGFIKDLTSKANDLFSEDEM